jgi:transposase-like protein
MMQTNGATGPATPRPALESAPNIARLPLRRFPDAVVERVRDLVTGTGLPIGEIARQTGISHSMVGNWIRKGGWRRPPDAPAMLSRAAEDFTLRRARLLVRLYRVLGRQLDGIEQRARADDGGAIEKDARTLGVLAKTLETLIALGRDDGASRMEPEFAERDEMDAALADRITRWAKGG